MSTKKIALVTGGSRGLGRDMAINLAKKGLDVVITYNSNETAASETIADIEQAGGNGIALQLDARNIKSFQDFKNDLVAKLKTTFDTQNFDYLVNNAGFGHEGSVADTTEEAFDDLMNVHFKGSLLLDANTFGHLE